MVTENYVYCRFQSFFARIKNHHVNVIIGKRMSNQSEIMKRDDEMTGLDKFLSVRKIKND